MKLKWQQPAFIRVIYAVTIWDKIGQKLYASINAYEPLDRAGLANDCFSFCWSHSIHYSLPFCSFPSSWNSSDCLAKCCRSFQLSTLLAVWFIGLWNLWKLLGLHLSIGKTGSRKTPADWQKHTKAILAHINFGFETYLMLCPILSTKHMAKCRKLEHSSGCFAWSGDFQLHQRSNWRNVGNRPFEHCQARVSSMQWPKLSIDGFSFVNLKRFSSGSCCHLTFGPCRYLPSLSTIV